MSNIKYIHIFGGGTISPIATHLAVCAPAYGGTARRLQKLIAADTRFNNYNVELELTKMAGGCRLETNEDIAKRIAELKESSGTKIIFLTAALCDYKAQKVESPSLPGWSREEDKIGANSPRIASRAADLLTVEFAAADKLVSSVRTGRKDIFLVAFKVTTGFSCEEMYKAGLRLCKEGSCNLVLVNDLVTNLNMIVTPEEAAYHTSTSRNETLQQLIDMAFYRSQLTFTQSTVVEGNPVSWYDERVPASLRTVVDYCISKRAYKPFNNATVGHFAVKLSDTEFLTSIRKSNFNNLSTTGLVYVKTDGPDTVLAYGAKPSVGGQSQRIVFNDHQGFDCIVHFHCPIKKGNKHDIPTVSQREVECGSHQCGLQTSKGLKTFGNLKAVYLDNHGPNIVFNKSIDPAEIIQFIEDNFELSEKTGGYNL